MKGVESLKLFSAHFWILFFATFLGNTAIWIFLPFILIYMNTGLGISVTIGGTVMAINTVLRMASLGVAGELTDRLGRRTILLYSFLARVLLFGGLFFIKDILLFVVLYCVTGVFISLGDPARDAMVADMVPESHRVEAYSMMRVAINGGLIAGSTAGGIIATCDMPAVFAGAALLCGIAAVLTFLGLTETYMRTTPAHSFTAIIHDRGLLIVCSLMVAIGFMLGSLSIIFPLYSKVVLHLGENQIGTALALNGVIVVLFQFPVSKGFKRFGDTATLVLGCLLFGGGLLSMIGAVTFVHVLLVVVIVTVGELLIIPITTAMVSGFASPEVRGTYMGLYGLSVYAGFALSSFLGGYLFDLQVNAVWYASWILGICALVGFVVLGKRGINNSVIEEKN